MGPRTIWFLALGAASGGLTATATLYRLGTVGAPELFGVCFGIKMPSHCDGIDGAPYLFPGLIFGIVFAAAQIWRGRFDPGRAVAFLVASAIGNAVATFVCVGLFDVLDNAIEMKLLDLPLALAGAIAGAAGSAIVGAATSRLMPGSRWGWPIGIGAALGLLVPLVPEGEFAGVFAFYIIWQAGYAAALAASLADAR